MLYGSKNTLPNDERLIKLHNTVMKRCEGIAWSHCSLAAVASKPKLFSEVAEIIRQRQPWWGVETGIETGSPELAKRVMPAKAHPFKADDWPEVVRTGMGLMHDNKLIPAATLIVGSPEETEDDIVKTIELVDDLKDIRSLIVPLFFVPMGRLKDEHWFKDAQMTELHQELLVRCLQHGFRWLDDLIGLAFGENWQAKAMSPLYRFFKRIAQYKVRQAGIESKELMTRLK
jgi:radical SAM superfamily enzyme YgiQ (UPF0313 family)